MKKLLSLGMAAALLVITSAAFAAYPTLTGATGVVDTPTAEVVAPGQFQIAADWYDTEVDSMIPIRLQYGVAQNFELGAMYTLGQGDNPNFWGANAKFATPLTLGGAAWSVGAQYANIHDIDTTAWQAYFVGTKAFTTSEDGTSPSVKGSLGVNFTKIDFPSPIDSQDAFRAFINVDVTFANKLQLGAEFQTKGSDIESDPVSSVVVRYPFTAALTGEVGFTNALLTTGGTDHNIFAGLKYSFGGAAAEEEF